MRGRVLLAGFGFAFSSAAALAQTAPQQLPPAVSGEQVAQPGLPAGARPMQPSNVPLPFPENRKRFDAGRLSARRENGSWQVWHGSELFRDLGTQGEANATDFVRTLRASSATEWATIGGGARPVVEYGLVNGLPSAVQGFAKNVTSIDHKSLRVEAVKGVWVVRDDEALHFNFGLKKDDAEQAVAVVQKYGFNRVGQIGYPTPVVSYLFVGHGPNPNPPLGGLGLAAQLSSLEHTGVMVPGVGFVGEMVKFDPRKLDVRRDGADWVVASGPDVFARCGHNEWQARDVMRMIQDARFTEFCTVGGPGGVTFFLVNGKAPNRVPFAAQGERFDPGTLRVAQVGKGHVVVAGGKRLFDVGGPADGEALVKLLKHYGFDQVCHIGEGRPVLRFLARNR